MLAAASLAGLALTRAEFGWVVSVLLVFFAAAWLLYRDGRLGRLAAVYALALALCLPWLAYTYSVSGTPLTWASSGPLSLYWMSSPQPADRGDWHGADSVFSDPRLASHRPFFRGLQGSDLAAQNRELVDRALSNVRSHPVKFLRNVTDNLGRMWFNAPYSFKSPGAASAIYALPNAAVLLALLVGLLRVRRLPRYPLLAFGSLVGASFLLHAVLSAYPRMLFPVVPFAIWLVVLARTRALPEVRDA